VHDNAEVVHVSAPGFDVTVYDVMGESTELGATHETTAEFVDGAAETVVGAPGRAVRVQISAPS
jgi:hypothetical protein